MGAGDTAARARETILETLDAMPGDALATVVTTGPRPEILVGPRAPRAMVAAALDRWRPVRTAHDPAPALDLGLDLAGKGGSLLFLTDREGVAAPDRYRVAARGESLPNVAIVGARRMAADAETERLHVDLAAWADGPLPTTVTVEFRDGEESLPVDEREVEVTPGRTMRLSWTLPAVSRPVRVRLAVDALHVDDEILLLPAPRRVVGVHLTLPEATIRSLRLWRAVEAIPDADLTDEIGEAPLVFTDRPGVAAPGATEVVVAAPGEDRDDWIGPFLIERRRAPGGGRGPALLGGVTLEGVLWSASPTLPPGMPLVLAGDTPLLTEEPASGGGVRLRLNLDPARSNLAASPDWPILLTNLVASVRERLPGPGAVNVRVGDEIAYRLPVGSTPDLSLVGPDGLARPARGFPLLTWEARRTGLHRLMEGDVERARFAVGFVDPAESDLTGRGEGDREAKQETTVEAAGAAAGGRAEARVLALLLLLVVAADWWVLGRAREGGA
jgi:hypothetical protein